MFGASAYIVGLGFRFRSCRLRVSGCRGLEDLGVAGLGHGCPGCSGFVS